MPILAGENSCPGSAGPAILTAVFAAREALCRLPDLPADFAPRSLGTRVMLNLLGPATREPFCDRLSRRNFLRIGSLGAAGLTLPQLFQAESRAGIAKSRKSLILIYLVGGPPQLDMFDLKPNAPREVAGPFRPIKTNVPGRRDLRAHAAAGPADGSPNDRPFDRRQPGGS